MDELCVTSKRAPPTGVGDVWADAIRDHRTHLARSGELVR
jgi:hypothetical protein